MSDRFSGRLSFRFWEVQLKYSEGPVITKRFTGDELLVGSSPKCQIRVSQPVAERAVVLGRAHDNSAGRIAYSVEGISGFRFQAKNAGGTWTDHDVLHVTEVPEIRVGDCVIKVRDITNERRAPRFDPEKWAFSASEFESKVHALWHFRNDVLQESVDLPNDGTEAPLRCGYKLKWLADAPNKLLVIDNTGIPQTVELAPGRQGATRAVFQDNIFVVTKMPSKKKMSEVPVDLLPNKEPNNFLRAFVGILGSLLVLIALVPLLPKDEPKDEVAQLEELPADVAKIILEAPKQSGGDGREGGGGVEDTTNMDKRGGSGFEASRMAESSGPDEVLVTKGALGAIQQAEKVLGSGVLKAIEVTGAIAGALGALDEGLKTGKIQAAGVPGVGVRSNGAGSAKGALGALAALGGGGSAGGGVGVGGVGTKGFGGGGGGGKGSGFGTGIGSGLGKGDGARNVAFDSGAAAVQGGLERSEVEAVIQQNISQIRFCYNRGLRNNPSLQGRVTSSFVISGEGKVRSSRIAGSTLGVPEVDDCIRERVASWAFPKPRGGGEVTVNYPFLLRSQ